MEQKKNIIITDTLSGIGKEAYKGYLGHALCLEGRCHIMFNGKGLEMKRGVKADWFSRSRQTVASV